ncbi:PREDICTED: CMP-N-acetylneuraminate-beta-1,4-galactoside alpha-2,3-sialyltransferase-like [Phaethon lepturus]|uniref:CMP-N-acetylneuraminate-beta-1,4-galactoside alpha-2,3-sialyltransferase-like n=1 Tax=Phaethon lepturus TaxID=97097 RepID=UPI0005305AA5|nr:PREDICTED: CMP-N-acetylneuraminate-beta-1,4-galactoside alpha-2,3-sialyltransferase-like [Phaethon lepturus]
MAFPVPAAITGVCDVLSWAGRALLAPNLQHEQVRRPAAVVVGESLAPASAEEDAGPKALIKQATTQSVVAGLVPAALGVVEKGRPEFEGDKYDNVLCMNHSAEYGGPLRAQGNFSSGTVVVGEAHLPLGSSSRRLRFSKPAPMFLDDSFRKWARIRDFVPPFGIKGQDNLIKAILSATKDYRLTPALDSLSCRRCIIVGNGGVLANKSLGLKIDDYDVVVRLNSAPVKGFEKDVGGKTTLRITYPEGAIQKMEQYEKDSLFVLAGFKWQDFKWLKYIVYKEKVSASDGFWKSVATRVPREPHEIRILNPYFIQEAAFSFIGLPFNNGLMGRGNIPTLGSVAITMALHNCDEVAVAGFGYDMSSPNAPLHYYENIKMSAIKESWTHNIQREKEFLRKLVKARVITDLTSGI